MLTTNKKLLPILGLSLGLLYFTSCDPQQSTETTVEEDKENIAGLFDDIVAEAEAIESGCGVQSFDRFYGLNNGNVSNQTWVDDITRALETALNYDYVDQTRELIFSNHTGTYQWDANTRTFNRSSTPSNEVVVLAPSAPGMANNAQVTVGSYTQQRTVFDGEQYWLPNSAAINVKVDNNDCAGFEIMNATYDNGAFMMPTGATFKVMLAPYNFEITSSRVSGNTYDMTMKASNNGDEKFSAEGEMTFADNDFSDLTGDDVDRAVGSFSYGDFKMPFDVDIKALNDLLNPSETQINEMVKVTVEYKGNEIGRLEYREGVGNSGGTIIMIYRDETTEDLQSEYNDLVDRLEVVFSDFF